MAAPSYDQKCFHKNPQIVAQQVVDELLLVPLQPGQFAHEQGFVMNEIGGKIWDLIDGQRRVEDIVGMLVDEYQVAPEDCASDLMLFFQHLERIGAVRAV